MAGPSAAVKYKSVLRALAQVPSRMSAKAAFEIEKAWRRSYMAGTDPYGKEWAANKPSTIRKKGHDLVMVDSGGTLEATRVRPLPGAGISLRTGPNAAWHLERAGARPARPVLPLRGIPPTWRAKLQEIAKSEAIKAVRSAR